MTRNIWTTAVVLVGSLSLSSAFAAGPGPAANAARAGKIVSVTSSPDSGRSENMYTVPLRNRLLITQACVQHTAMVIEVGDDDDRITYGSRGCTDYFPGFVVAGGQTITCDNGSGLERTCAVVGVLEQMPAAEGQRVRFHELR